jgi:MFS family permease
MRFRRTTAFWVLVAILGALFFASSVPSPLYPVYQSEWGFSSITLTSVFAVYALALLGSLLIVGSISDHIGRRPTLLAALALEILAMLAFAAASDVGWLFAARTLQGIATGAAMGAISAALLDLQPEAKPWLGGLMGAVCPLSGLALGSLSAGVLVDYGPDPTRFVFWLLVGAFVLSIPATASIPETVDRDGGWVRSLPPRLSVPRHMRAAFIAALPCLAVVWALGGLVLSLGASLAAGVLGETSHAAAALPIFVMSGISAVASIGLRPIQPQKTARGGLVGMIVGLMAVLWALATESSSLFLVGSAITGLGFGPAFSSVFRVLSERAPVDQRAALVSSVFAVSYIAFSVPAVAAGAAVTQHGLRETAEIYGGVLIALAALALLLSSRLDDSRLSEPQKREHGRAHPAVS